MNFNEHLKAELDAIENAGLFRRLRLIGTPQGACIAADGRSLVNFSSNDYLGLANHPALKEAAATAIHEYGAGSGASRLISGSLEPHQRLESALARFKGTAAALSFTSGYAAASGAINSLIGKDDIIILDKLVHACVVDAARLSGARLRVFAHNQVDDLEKKLVWASAQHSEDNPKTPRILVVVESVYSMDGDQAPLKQIVNLKDRFGAWLMVDEAHATGLFGERCSGLIESLGLTSRVEIQMGTLGKALGASGGFICGSFELIRLLVNRARSFIFTTAPVPAAVAAAQAGVELAQSAEGKTRCERLWNRIDLLKQGLTDLGWDCLACNSAIIPIVIGDERVALSASDHLRNEGFLVPAVRYPTVARGASRLRITLTADHTEQDIHGLLTALHALSRQKI